MCFSHTAVSGQITGIFPTIRKFLFVVEPGGMAHHESVQLFGDNTASRTEWNQAMMGSNPMIVVAKSIERLHELTLAELLRNWKLALNRFMIEFEDRLIDYI